MYISIDIVGYLEKVTKTETHALCFCQFLYYKCASLYGKKECVFFSKFECFNKKYPNITNLHKYIRCIYGGGAYDGFTYMPGDNK